ncbi:MAG: Arginine N-methyltransferase 2 [Tremellales sp. Tagirdzhanova-0007]|nr:MAG: Arginine N-methyltransferase 2 [Tremellales sp. Tagirdzhanova-0007]
MSSELPEDLLELANDLVIASQSSSLAQISDLLGQSAPAWYQDHQLGWACLHYAAERREPELLRVLLRGGAIWNAVDRWGRTAGEVCLSLGDQQGWEIIRNEGIRSEMLHHALSPSSEEEPRNPMNMKLRAEDKTSAGDNLAFLQSKLTWDIGTDGRERVLDADGNGVMMGWEEPLSVFGSVYGRGDGADSGGVREHVRLMIMDHPDAQPGGKGISVLNVGYGLGVTIWSKVDRLFRTPLSSSHPQPSHHTIIEAHPQVLEHMRANGVYDWPGVRVLEGRWQEWLLDPEKFAQLAAITSELGAIFFDTFAEGYADLKAFFEVLPDLLEAEHGTFSFWNGLGATNPTIYSVASNLAELHLEDVGLGVTWHDVPISESLREEVWKGLKRRYWELPGYRLPIARMQLR